MSKDKIAELREKIRNRPKPQGIKVDYLWPDEDPDLAKALKGLKENE